MDNGTNHGGAAQTSAAKEKAERNGKRKLLKRILSMKHSTQLFIYRKLGEKFKQRDKANEELKRMAEKLGVEIKKLELK